jgi:hypothetical protein
MFMLQEADETVRGRLVHSTNYGKQVQSRNWRLTYLVNGSAWARKSIELKLD